MKEVMWHTDVVGSSGMTQLKPEDGCSDVFTF